MRPPAYSKALRQAISDGRVPQHGVAIFLDERPPARSAFACIACFRDSDPQDLDWSVVAGLDAIVANGDRADPDRLAALVEVLKAAKPRRLQLWKADGSMPEFVILGEGAA